MGMLPDVTRLLMLFVFIQGIAAQTVYTDFLFCPKSQTDEIDCGSGALIDIIFAGAINSLSSDPCSNQKNIKIMVSDWENILCGLERKIFKCHGNHTCTVDRSMADFDLYCTDGETRPSDVLFVRYTCHELDTSSTVQLPSSQIARGNIIDILSPNFPEKVTEEEYNTTCTIMASSQNTVDLHVETKMRRYDGEIGTAYNDINCSESVSLEQEGEEDAVLICNTGYFNATQNRKEVGALKGKKWKLQYERPNETIKRGKFWLQFTAGVDLEVSCVNHIPGMTDENNEGSGNKDEKKDLPIWIIVVGVVGFLLLVLLIVVVIFCLRRRRKRKPESKKSTTTTSATAAPEEGTGVYCIAGAIDEKHGEANGNLKNEEDEKTKKPHTYVNVEQPKVEYAEINVKKKSKKTDRGLGDEVKKAVDDETIMCENDTLYSSAGKNSGKVDYAEIRFDDSPIKGKVNGDKSGDAPYNDVL